MKATFTIEYNPEEPSEERYINNLRVGYKFKSVLWELDQYLRTRLKYEDNLPEEAGKALDETRNTLWELLKTEGLDLDD